MNQPSTMHEYISIVYENTNKLSYTNYLYIKQNNNKCWATQSANICIFRSTYNMFMQTQFFLFIKVYLPRSPTNNMVSLYFYACISANDNGQNIHLVCFFYVNPWCQWMIAMVRLGTWPFSILRPESSVNNVELMVTWIL